MNGMQGVPVKTTEEGGDLRRSDGWGLVRFGGDGGLEAIPLYDGAIVGRGSGATEVVEVDDADMAPRHAQFFVRPDGAYVADLDTPTGTRLDGVAIRMMGLAQGSVLRFGKTVALFVERDLLTYQGRPPVFGDEMVLGSRHTAVFDEAVDHVRQARSLVVCGGPGIGKSTFARVAVRTAGTGVAVHAFDGAAVDPSALLTAFDVAGPAIWLVEHIDRVPRAMQADLVRTVRAVPGSTLVATVVGAIEDGQADGRIGASLMGLVESRVLPVPDLEDRREDLPALTLEMLRRVGVRLSEGSEDVFEAVLRAGWPGGMRELGTHLAAAFDAGGSSFEAAKILSRSVPRSGPKSPLPLQEADADLARTRLRRALDHASGTVAVAARELRMSRQAFYRELRRLDMEGKKRMPPSPGV